MAAKKTIAEMIIETAEIINDIAEISRIQVPPMDPIPSAQMNGMKVAKNQPEESLSQRLSVVEATLRVQDATGASHLQQLEQHPQAFGLASSARPAIRRLRRQRNRALHGTCVSDRIAEIETRVMDSEKEHAAFNKVHASVGKGKGWRTAQPHGMIRKHATQLNFTKGDCRSP